MMMLTDVQDFLMSAQKITTFFYRQCFSMANSTYQDAIMEAITHIVFTAENGAVFDLVNALFKAQHSDVIGDLRGVIDEYGAAFRLADMKMCNVGLE